MTTTTTTTTVMVTMYIPSNYWTSCNGSCTNVSTTTTTSTVLASWNFDSNFYESTNTYNGYMSTGGSPTYISGYVNQAFVANSVQYMIANTYLNFANRSFTIEAWLMITNTVNPSVLYGIFGQCQTPAPGKCLHCIIQTNRYYLGFYGNDLAGTTNVSLNVWTHVAFVYDFILNKKSIYLNGILDATSSTGNAYQGTSGSINVGYTYVGPSVTSFPGYIDQVTVSNRVKTECEIQNDATLVSRFTFDNTIIDSGPNSLPSYITVQSNSGIAYISGRINQALMLSRTNAFFQSCSYYSLSISNQPFSFALWINPNVSAGTLIHLSSDRSGSGNWCLPKLGFSSNGTLVAQSWRGSVVSVFGPQIPSNNWTHIVQTWSSTNGLRLYINGNLYGSSIMTSYNNNNGNSMCIFLGTSGFGTNCQTSDIVMGSYSGAIDEFYVYNRELTLNEICTLTHP